MRALLFAIAVGSIAWGCGGPGRPPGTCELDEHCVDDPDHRFCVEGACLGRCRAPGEGCTAMQPRCTEMLECGACVGDINCSGYADTPRCAPDGSCVGCVDATQCSQTAPICDQGSRACRACVSDDECPSAVCEPSTGSCVPADGILYATPTGDGNADCSMSTPCSAQRAVALLDPAHRYIKLASGSYPVALDLTNRSASIHGVGATVQGSAIVNDGADITLRGLVLPAITAASSTTTPKLLLEDVELGSLDGRPVELVARRTRWRPIGDARPLHLQGDGVRSSQATIERSTMIGGAGMCILDTTRLTITNSVIANLVGTDTLLPCLPLPTVAGPITIAQSTLYDAPIICSDGSIALRLLDDIVYTPTHPLALEDAVVGTRCEVRYSIITPNQATLTGANNQLDIDPRLVSPMTGDFHLLPDSPAIDRGDPSTTPTPDIAGTPRPQGLANDIGAYEFTPP